MGRGINYRQQGHGSYTAKANHQHNHLKGDRIMNENNINITNVNTVNVPQPSRGAGTVLMVLFFWWVFPTWWMTLASIWLVWLIIAGVVAIFDPDFFTNNWYQPWPAWMFGIR
jgi:hypothetical protein